MRFWTRYTEIMKKIFLLLAFYSFSVFALNEGDYALVYSLLDDESFYTIGEFEGVQNRTLKYAQFGKTKGVNGPLVFVNGRGENLFKYIELFYDLNQKGWSPIYTYDHRGQGLSRNPLSKKYWGEIEDYAYYTEDLKNFLELVKKQTGQKSLSVIAHSMGALIVVDYLQNYDHSDWLAVVLSAPMFGIQISLATTFDYLASLYCSLISCLKRNLNKNNSWSVLSHSKAREGFFRYLQNERFPYTDVVVPSVSWLRKSAKVQKLVMEPEKIKKIKIPVLVLQATQDVVIKNEHLKTFCDAIPKNCQREIFEGKHALYLGKDPTRNATIKQTLSFFKTK